MIVRREWHWEEVAKFIQDESWQMSSELAKRRVFPGEGE